MSTQPERAALAERRPAQPETVAALLRQLHVNNASAIRAIDDNNCGTCAAAASFTELVIDR